MATIETVKVWKDGCYAVVNVSDLDVWREKGWEVEQSIETDKPKRVRKKA